MPAGPAARACRALPVVCSRRRGSGGNKPPPYGSPGASEPPWGNTNRLAPPPGQGNPLFKQEFYEGQPTGSLAPQKAQGATAQGEAGPLPAALRQQCARLRARLDEWWGQALYGYYCWCVVRRGRLPCFPPCSALAPSLLPPCL